MKTPGKIKTQSQVTSHIKHQLVDEDLQKNRGDSPKLRRRYPPHQVLHEREYERINKLKDKYLPQQPQKDQTYSTQRQQNNLKSLNNFNNKQNLASDRSKDMIQFVHSQQNPASLLVQKIKEQIQGTRQIRLKHNSYSTDVVQVSSTSHSNLISNSSQQSYKESLCQSAQSKEHTQDFMDKVEQVNGRIEGRIGLLQNKIKELQFLKRKKLVSQRKEKQNQNQYILQKETIIKREKQRQYQIQRERQLEINHLAQQQQEIQDLKRIKQQRQKHKSQHISQSVLMQSSKSEQQQQSNVLLPTSFMKKSTCQQLIGKFKGSQQFPKEFTLIVNRIREQIQMDAQFTKIVINIQYKRLQEIRIYTRKRYADMDMSYLQITPMEIDPLIERGQEQYPNHSIPQLGDWIYRIYIKIEKSFSSKLFQKFQERTVAILLEQLEGNSHAGLTIGHLASYINMRTGQSFRNRALVKLLRRMNICSQNLDKASFKKTFCRKNLPEIKQ